MPSKRGPDGKFVKQRGWHLHSKGYMRYSAGKLRGQMVHRAVAEKVFGHKLSPKIEVHHADGNKRRNLKSNFALVPKRLHALIERENRIERRLKKEHEEKHGKDATV